MTRTDYFLKNRFCTHIIIHDLAVDHTIDILFTGGPVVQALPATTCKDRGLKPGLEFLSFQFGQNA